MGVFHPDLVGIQVRALQRLGAEHALVVYGRDGMDEVSLGAATMVGELKNGEITEYEIHPEDFGLPMASNRALKVETPEQSRPDADERAGQPARRGARHRDLQRRRRACMRPTWPTTIQDGIAKARAAIESGAAKAKLEQLVELVQVAAQLDAMSDILNKIVAVKREEIAAAQKKIPLAADARGCGKPRADARLRRRAARARSPPGKSAVIAEIKKASPSKGVLRADFIPADIAQSYAEARGGLPVGADRPPVLPGPARLPEAGARVLRPAGAAQGLHGRCLPDLRVAGHGRRLRPADRGLPGRRADGRARGDRPQPGHGGAGGGARRGPSWSARSSSRRRWSASTTATCAPSRSRWTPRWACWRTCRPIGCWSPSRAS